MTNVLASRLTLPHSPHGLAMMVASVVLIAAPVVAQAQEIRQTGNAWFTQAQAELQAKLARQPNTTRAKNIILLISDGNGVGTNYATRLYVGQRNGGLGDDHVLAHEAFPYLALSKTYNVNAQTPDSAGTGTAMLSGVKVRAGVLGFDETVVRGDCTTISEPAKLTSFAEIAKASGRKVGVISTARITHATPASAYANSAHRNWEDDTNVPAGCPQKDIARQLVDKLTAGAVDLAMGGGRRHFLPTNAKGEEGRDGRRKDGVNLVEQAKAGGAQHAWNLATFEALKLDGSAPILGLFESSHMKYEHERTGEPSLAEMTEAAIKTLSTNTAGFFLLVEAGRVDHANHRGNLHRVVTDGAAFDAAVAKAVAMTDARETLIIVTADHEHAIAFNGYCGRGSPITGLCYKVDDRTLKHSDQPNVGLDSKPYTVAGYLNGPGAVIKPTTQGPFVGERPDLTNAQATDPDYAQQALIPLVSETHSGEDVAIYALGPWAHLFDGTVEQNYVFHVMKHALEAK